MNLQDQIDSFQKLIFAHFRGSANNECRISALVPQVKESYGIYRFITSMMRAMHRSEHFLSTIFFFTKSVEDKFEKKEVLIYFICAQELNL